MQWSVVASSSFASAVDQFLSDRADLRDSHLTLVVALEHVATALDESVSAALMTEYRKLLTLLEAASAPAAEETREDDLLSPLA